MPEVDVDWAKAQIIKARKRQNVGNAALKLLAVWNEIANLNEAAQEDALDAFAKLARSQALVLEGEHRYVPVQIGAQVNVGDTVRVRADAFSSLAGQKHNGRIGKIVAKRNGDIIVNSIDEVEPALESVHYPANVLELRIK